MKTPCLGAHLGSLKKTLVARTHNLGALGARAAVRQQPCCLRPSRNCSLKCDSCNQNFAESVNLKILTDVSGRNVRQLAPWTIRPRQLAPNLQTR